MATKTEARFMLPIPLEVEHLLEKMMPPRSSLLAFRARSAMAGDMVAEMIRKEARRQGISDSPPDEDAAPAPAPAAKAGKRVRESLPLPPPAKAARVRL